MNVHPSFFNSKHIVQDLTKLKAHSRSVALSCAKDISKLLFFSALFFYSLSLQAAISGRVINITTDAALTGALVSIQASNTDVTTDSSGNFSLPNGGSSSLTIVAAKKGFYNASANVSDGDSGIIIRLEAVPEANTPDHWSNYQFAHVESGTECAKCHQEQYNEWNGSPMSNGGVNTWVHDIYNGDGTDGGMTGFVYTRDSVHKDENAESECAACHQPESWVNEPYSAIKSIDEGSPSIAHGVSCEVCHKIANIDESKPNFPGLHPDSVTLNLPRSDAFGDPDHDIQYGVLGDTNVYVEFEMRPSHQPQVSAEICAACHQDKNDHDNDGDFEDAGGVISEPTFVEWLESDYGDPESGSYQSCADCHMPARDANAACSGADAFDFQNLNRPLGDIRSHDIRGTTAEFLDNAVELSLTAVNNDGTVEVEASVFNSSTGHHVPTGVTIRNMILLVEAFHPDGSPLEHTGSQQVHTLGGVGDPEQGYYADLPGKLYAKVNQDATGASPTFFTDATGILFDSRIPANETDATNYTFEATQSGEIQITARLIYRRSWRFLTDAKGWTMDGHGNPLEDVAAPYYGHLMEEANTNVDIPSSNGDSGSTDTDDESSGGGGSLDLTTLIMLLILASSTTLRRYFQKILTKKLT